MGMFDSVYLPCPCGEMVELQSKAGRKMGDRFGPDDTPVEIALELATFHNRFGLGAAQWRPLRCGACGARLGVGLAITADPGGEVAVSLWLGKMD